MGRSHDADDALMAPTLAVRTPRADDGDGTAPAADASWEAYAAPSAAQSGLWDGEGTRAELAESPSSLVDWTAWSDTTRGPNARALQSPRRWDWDVVDLAEGAGAPDENADLVVALSEGLEVEA
ncbi:MAG: hypothetical protein HY615_06095 [Candidatus Rokubacteria bacterium]|nr:hypothetical protein [Candidatus Rokubacteria bacterium]